MRKGLADSVHPAPSMPRTPGVKPTKKQTGGQSEAGGIFRHGLEGPGQALGQHPKALGLSREQAEPSAPARVSAYEVKTAWEKRLVHLGIFQGSHIQWERAEERFLHDSWTNGNFLPASGMNKNK